MNTVGGAIVSAITLLAVAKAGAAPLYTIDRAIHEELLTPSTAPALPYLHTSTVEASVDDLAVPVSSQLTGVSYAPIAVPDDVSIEAMSFADGWSRPTAVAPEPSGLAALAIVMVTLGIGGVMRLAQEVGSVVTQCARYRIELPDVRRWWSTHRRQGR